MPRGHDAVCGFGIYAITGHKVFYDYYQIGRDNKRSRPKNEPKEEKELKDTSPHSLFGVVWQIASETGWSYHRIMWKIPFDTIMRMVADALPKMF